MTIEDTPLNDLVDEFIANYETELNTTVPSQRRAFLRVMAVQQAVLAKGTQKRVMAAQRAVFAVTAGADGLAIIANEFEVPRGAPAKYKATVSVSADPATSVPAEAELTSEATGAYYKVDATASESGGHITFDITAEDYGDAANLDPSSGLLTFVSPIPGVATNAYVATVNAYGADEEDLEEWRARVLAAERAAYGGGNPADYRYWGEQVAEVAAIFPYSGKPLTWRMTSELVYFEASTNAIVRDTSTAPFGVGTLGPGDMIQVEGSDLNDGFYTVQDVVFTAHITIHVVEPITDEALGNTITISNLSLPGDRTVFVEADDADRVPSSDLLDLVRAAINYGLDGLYQPALGDTDSTLYVEPVSLAEVYIEVLNLVVDPAFLDQCKTKVVEDVRTHLAICRPFIVGLDFEMDRRDMITDLSIGKVVQGVLEAFAASSDGIRISIGSASADTVTSYQLGMGEIPVLALVWDEDDSDWTD